MTEENVMLTAEPVEETVVEEKKKPKKAKKTKKEKPVKARKLEEVVELATKDLSDKEKSLLIDYLRDQIICKDNTIEAYKQNCEAAYEKIRMTEEQYKSMESYYRDQLKYVDQQIISFAQAVRRATVGGTN